jgi:hypothetical protein
MNATELARQVKAWRGKVPARVAAEQIGVPRRTLEWIEQGNGFRYPELLLIALEATRDQIREGSK